MATGPSQIAREYFTSEEMVQFKKPKKKRKVRKKLKADDLLPLGEEESTKDHGRRYVDNIPLVLVHTFMIVDSALIVLVHTFMIVDSVLIVLVHTCLFS